jgi:hypothetical protein
MRFIPQIVAFKLAPYRAPLQQALIQERTSAARTPCGWRLGLADGARHGRKALVSLIPISEERRTGLLTRAATGAPDQVSLGAIVKCCGFGNEE